MSPYCGFLNDFDVEIGNTISNQFTNVLLSIFDKISILNINEFVKQKGYSPCIGSNFVVSDGGSVYYEKTLNGVTYTINTYNGTLSNISTDDDHLDMTFYEYSKLYEQQKRNKIISL